MQRKFDCGLYSSDPQVQPGATFDILTTDRALERALNQHGVSKTNRFYTYPGKTRSLRIRK
jgi:hypothetical protein